jgi:hypothetical protein
VCAQVLSLLLQVASRDQSLASASHRLQEAAEHANSLTVRQSELSSEVASLQRQLAESNRQLRASQRVHADSLSEWKAADRAHDSVLSTVRAQLATVSAELADSRENCLRLEASCSAARSQHTLELSSVNEQHAQR